MMRELFTTFLIKQIRGRFGLGNASLGLGLITILFINETSIVYGTKIVKIRQPRQQLFAKMSVFPMAHNLTIAPRQF